MEYGTDRAEPDHYEPDHQSQTNTCVAKVWSEICNLLRCYAAQSSNSLPTFWDSLSVPSSGVKRAPRVDRTQMKITDTFFIGWGILSILQFLKKCGVLETDPFIARQRSA